MAAARDEGSDDAAEVVAIDGEGSAVLVVEGVDNDALQGTSSSFVGMARPDSQSQAG